MNIEDYFADYKNQIDSVKLPDLSTHSNTVKDFYDDCLSKNLLKRDNVIAWHKMLMEYITLPGAIFWIRYYESGSRKKGRYNNRRACVTRFSDGFSYVFVSNFDAQEIYNMIDKGVVPSAQEFLQLMKEFKYHMHYDTGKSCEESDICAYPNIGSYKAGTLTSYLWYFAHIEGIKKPYKLKSGEIDLEKKNENLREHIFPRGEINDWKKDASTGKYIRDLDYSLNNDEKKIVIAHFLRFIDPLNYFVTPKTRAEIDCIFKDKDKNIGEDPKLTKYVSSRFEKEYGNNYLDEFKKYALVCDDGALVDENHIIDITYFMAFKVQKNTKAKSTNNKSKRKKSAGKKFTGKSKLAISSTKTISNSSRAKKYSPVEEQIIEDAKIKFPYQFRQKANKAADLFIRIIMYLNNHHLLDKDDIKMLTSEESKKVFKTGFITLSNDINFDRKRYYKEEYNINGINYHATNDFGLGDKNIDCIVKWAATKGLIL